MLGDEAALLRMAKEEAVQGEMGVWATRASTRGDKARSGPTQPRWAGRR